MITISETYLQRCHSKSVDITFASMLPGSAKSFWKEKFGCEPAYIGVHAGNGPIKRIAGT